MSSELGKWKYAIMDGYIWRVQSNKVEIVRKDILMEVNFGERKFEKNSLKIIIA